MTEETAAGPHHGDPGPDKGIPEEGVQPRAKWANKMEFLLSMTGQVIGLGNFWRFPYLCYKNGGSVFFVPYVLCALFCGVPLFILETALGQYTGEGGVTAWRKICPMFEGVGIAGQVIVTYLNIYYIVIFAWAFFYLFQSFKNPLPWSTCDNSWNTDSCHGRLSIFANPHLFQPDANWSFLNNITMPIDYYDNPSIINGNGSLLEDTSSENEFWIRRVLRMSDSMSVANVHWDLALCLLLAWVICYFCIFKGIKTTGKAVYFTATVPYLLLFILFIRGVSLPGAGDGLAYYLTPNFSKIADPNIWTDALMEVIFSLALCQGVLPALGSYNKYNNNCYRDCIAICCLNFATSIFAGFAVFSVLGFMARQLDLPIDEVATAGPSLAFIAFPKALSMLPGASFWSVLFFLMILILGIDNQFVRVECLATAITDMFPRQLRRPGRRELLVLVIAVVCFLFGLSLVTEGGIVLFTLMDTYGGSEIPILFIAVFETVVIAWVYGADRFCDNIADMIGYRPIPVLKYCWLFIIPLICGVTLLKTPAQYSSIYVHGYVTGVGGVAFGSILMFIPLMCIPLFILITLCKNPDNMTTPSGDLRQARPHKPVLSLCKRVIFKAQGQPNRTRAERAEKVMMEEHSGV